MAMNSMQKKVQNHFLSKAMFDRASDNLRLRLLEDLDDQENGLEKAFFRLLEMK